MKKLLSLIFTVVILQACDCIQFVAGTVADKETGEPISGALVHKKGKMSDSSYTDTKGRFEFQSISGGLFRCPPMNIVIAKEGYSSAELKGGGSIVLEKRIEQ